jgi:hypothetical protein
MTDQELAIAIKILRYRLSVAERGCVQLSQSMAELILEELRTLLADRKAMA